MSKKQKSSRPNEKESGSNLQEEIIDRRANFPKKWNIGQVEIHDYSKLSRAIYIGKLWYEDKRIIVFSKPSKNIGILLSTVDIRNLGHAISLHFIEQRPIKIKDDKVFTPEKSR